MNLYRQQIKNHQTNRMGMGANKDMAIKNVTARKPLAKTKHVNEWFKTKANISRKQNLQSFVDFVLKAIWFFLVGWLIN